jgi:hypothetical protein
MKMVNKFVFDIANWLNKSTRGGGENGGVALRAWTAFRNTPPRLAKLAR